jgi:hypothetical protein
MFAGFGRYSKASMTRWGAQVKINEEDCSNNCSGDRKV